MLNILESSSFNTSINTGSKTNHLPLVSTFCWSRSLDILAITVNGFLSPAAGVAVVAPPVLGWIAIASAAVPPKSAASICILDNSSSVPAVDTAILPLTVVLVALAGPCKALCL